MSQERSSLLNESPVSPQSPLRVLHIVYPNFGYTFSGTTKHTLVLMRNWANPNIRLSLWGSDYPIDAQRGNQQFLWGGSSPRRHTRFVRIRWMLQLLWMLFRRRKEYDVVHFHILWWGTLLSPLLLHLLDKKMVYHMTLLGSDNPSAVGAQNLGWLMLALYKNFDGVIGLAPALIKDCREQHLSSELLVLPGFLVFDPPALPNPDRRAQVRQELGISDNDRVLIFVGSVIARKGIDILIDAFIRLALERPNLRLLLVGASTLAENPRLDDKFVAAQRDKLVNAKLDERVIWAGLISDELALIDRYIASDIFVFPTRAEGQGYVILEAMSCGLPVICTNLRGVTDMMVNTGETGTLVEVGDLGGFVSATAKLLDNMAICQQMGTIARQKALSDFGFEAYCNTLAQYYYRVAGKDFVAHALQNDGDRLPRSQRQ